MRAPTLAKIDPAIFLPIALWAMTGFFPFGGMVLQWLYDEWVKQPYGFINTSGSYQIKLNKSPNDSWPFVVVGQFRDGYCLVKDCHQDRYNFVSKSGEILCNPSVYIDAKDFSEGLAGVRMDLDDDSDPNAFPRKMIGGWLFIEKSGRIKIDKNFSEVQKFSEGLCAVRTKGSECWNYINTSGEVAIAGDFEVASDFHEGRAAVCKKGRWGMIDGCGAYIVPLKYSAQIESFSEGLSSVPESGEIIYINKDGSVHLKLKSPIRKAFQHARVSGDQFIVAAGSKSQFIRPRSNYAASEGLIVFAQGDKFGYCTLDGEPVIRAQFDYCWPFSEGMALVYDDSVGKFGYVDHQGKLAVPCRFTKAHDFSDGWALVNKEGVNFEFIDRSGVNRFGRSYMDAAPFQEGFAFVGKPDLNL